MILTIFYILGVVITFVLFIFIYIKNKWNITLGELILGIIISLMSWITIGVVLFIWAFTWFILLIPKILDWEGWDIEIFKFK